MSTAEPSVHGPVQDPWDGTDEAVRPPGGADPPATGAPAPGAPGGDWPSEFPSEVVGRQAAELRASVVRLAAEKLERAEAEAAAIRREAHEEAALARRRAAQLMVSRLEEAASAGEAVRDAALAEARQARLDAAAAVSDAVARVQALHTEVAGVADRSEKLMGWLTAIEDGLAALQHQLHGIDDGDASLLDPPPPDPDL